MNYEIAIPSYNRPELIQEKTLALLHRLNIPHEKITVFVADENEKRIYQNSHSKIVVGKLGLCNQRNFIRKYYPEGTKIIWMDDDVQDLKFINADKKILSVTNLDQVVEIGFKNCIKAGTKLWGIYPLINNMFMSHTITQDLRYIAGPFYGTINDQRSTLDGTLPVKEDFERTLEYYSEFGAVVRLNYVGILTKYYNNTGGLGHVRTEELVKKCCEELLKRYPMYCSVDTKKKGKYLEIKVRNSAKF